MKLIKQTLILFLLFSFIPFAYAISENALLDKLNIIESLVVSQPEQALSSISSLKKIHLQLTARQNVTLITYDVMANTYLNHHKIALNKLEKILKVTNVKTDKASLWLYYNTKAIVYWHMDKIEESLSLNLKAYNIVKSIKEYAKYQSASEENISYGYIKLGFFDKAIPYLESSLKLALTQDDQVVILATIYNNLGEAYLGVNDYEKSLSLLNKSLALRIKHKLTFHSSYSYHNLGLNYHAQNQYQKAEKAFKEAIKIRKNIGFIRGLIISKLALAQVYIKNNQYLLAENVISAAIDEAKKQSNNSSLSEAYNLQRKVYANKKDFQNAYQASLLYEQTLEHVVSRKTNAELARYLNNTETISKDLNILELEKNAKLKELQVANERKNVKIILIAVFIILIILAVFLWSMQKNKKIITNSNTELNLTLTQLKQTQEKLVKSGKMSALTTLVSKMAHQVNTPLGIAITGVSHIHEEVERFGQLVNSGKIKKTEIDSFISDLHQGSKLSSNSMGKVADLISQFKSISANLEAETQQEFEIFELISKQADLILIVHKENKPKVNINGCKVPLLGYPGALNKVFSQLITNSIVHAFEETLTPKIDIEIIKAEDSIEIHYQDNGKGIDSNIVNNVFEPFYTTTIGNKNLGIGLSIVYNLVVQLMQGNIQCKPQENKGIMFIISLPLTIKPS